MKGNRRLARQATIQALYQWQINPASCAEVEAQFLADPDRLAGANVAFFQELWRGVCGMVADLDPAIASHIPERRWEEVSEVERAILRLAAYELYAHRETPYRVVINEAVEMTKVFGAEHGHRFVNAVLDKLARQWRPEELGNP